MRRFGMGKSGNEEMVIGKRTSVEEGLFRMPGAWATLLLVLADALALEASLFLAYFLRETLSVLFPAWVPLEALRSVALAILLFPLGYALAGLYPGTDFPPWKGCGEMSRLPSSSFWPSSPGSGFSSGKVGAGVCYF